MFQTYSFSKYSASSVVRKIISQQNLKYKILSASVILIFSVVENAVQKFIGGFARLNDKIFFSILQMG